MNQPVSAKRWFGVLVLQAIPVVNIIMFLIWAFSDKTRANHPSLRSYARASLLFIIIVSAIWFVTVAVLGVSLASL